MRKAGGRKGCSLGRVQISPQIVLRHTPSGQFFNLKNVLRRRHILRRSIQPFPNRSLGHVQGLSQRGLPAHNRYRPLQGRHGRSRGSLSHMQQPYYYRSTPVNHPRSLQHYYRAPSIPAMREHLGTRLRKARIQAGLTQDQLASASGVSQKTISKIERGDQAVSSAVVQLARACGVAPEWLSEGIGTLNAAAAQQPPPIQAAPGTWIMQLMQIMIANGVPPEDAVKITSEASQAAQRVPVKRGAKRTG